MTVCHTARKYPLCQIWRITIYEKYLQCGWQQCGLIICLEKHLYAVKNFSESAFLFYYHQFVSVFEKEYAPGETWPADKKAQHFFQ